MALLATVVQTTFVARALGPRSYGVAALIIAIPSFLFSFLDPQSESAVVRYLARFERERDPSRAAAVVKTAYLVDLGLATAGSVVALLLAGWTSRHIVDDPSTWWLVVVAAAGLSAAGPAATSRAVLSTFGRFSRISSVSAVSSLVRNGAMVALVALGAGIHGLVFGAVLGQLFESAVLYGAARRALHEQTGRGWRTSSARDLRPHTGEMLRFMGYTELTTLSTAFIKHGDVLLLGQARGPAAAGLYRLASSLAAVAGRIVVPLQAVVYPDVARVAADRDEAGLRRLVRRHFLTVGLPLAAVGAAALPLVGPVLRLAAGSAYEPAVSLCQILLAGTLLALATYWLRPLYLATGRVRLFFALTLPVTVVTVVAMAFAAEASGAVGVAWARVLGSGALGTGLALAALARERRTLARTTPDSAWPATDAVPTDPAP